MTRLCRVVLLLALLAPTPAAAHSGRTAAAHPLPPVTVDGDFSEWPADLTAHPIALTEFGTPPISAADLTASFRVAYGPADSSLYLAIEVEDESLVVDTTAAANWNTGDGCEIYLHLDHEDRQTPILQYSLYGRTLLIGKPELARWAVQRAAGQQRYEWRLDLSQLGDDWPPRSPGVSLGLDVVVIDSDRDGSYSWVAWSQGLRKYESPDRLGDLLLIAADAVMAPVSGSLEWADTGEPVAGEKVVLRSVDHPRLWAIAETDAEGRARGRLPVGAYAFGTVSGAALDTVTVSTGDTNHVHLRLQPSTGVAVPAGPGTVVRQPSGVRQGAWQHFSAADGLPHAVSALLQDRSRNLWFGTENGVGRYDGQDLLILTPADGLVDARVRSLAEDAEGRIWVGTDNGLSRYDGSQFVNWTTGEGLPDQRVTALLPDSTGLWVGTEGGLARYDGKRFTAYTTRNGLTNNVIHALRPASAGGFWVGTEGGVNRYTAQGFTALQSGPGQLPVTEAYGLDEGPDGVLWIGTRNGILRYDGRAFTSYGAADGAPVIDAGEVLRGDLLVDGAGEVWAGTWQGSARGSDRGFVPLTPHGGLPSVQIRCLLEDREGQIWIGSEGGLSRYDARAFSYLTAAQGLGDRMVVSMVRDRDGVLWLGTHGGLYRYDGDGASLVGLADRRIYALLADPDGSLWIGWLRKEAPWGGITRYADGRLVSYDDVPGAPDAGVYCLLRDRQGVLWVGTRQGLCRFDGGAFTRYTLADGLPHDFVRCLRQDSGGRLWIGTEEGLCVCEAGTFTSFRGEPGVGTSPIGSVVEDAQAELWIGTGEGIYRRGADGFHALDIGEGLAASSVRAMTLDRRGVLWFGAYDGLGSYDGQVVQSLLRRDGLLDNSIHAIVDDDEGALWIAGGEGVTRYLPRRAPPLLDLGDVIADRRYGPVRQVELPGPVRLLAFELFARSFKTRPGAMVYRYRLVGQQDDWRTTHLGRVEYRDLPLGAYTFQAEAVDRDLCYSERLSVQVEVDPPYRQILLYALLGLSGALVVGLAARIVQHNRQLKARVHERTAELEEARDRAESGSRMKSEFLANMSHEIRTPLNAILGYAEILGDRLAGTPDHRFLDSIATSGRALLRLLNDLLDLSRIEAGKLPLEYGPVDVRHLLGEIEQIFTQAAGQKGLALRTTADERLPGGLRLDETRLRQVLLNLVGNAIKFTESGHVAVMARCLPRASEEETCALVLEVEDTGIGIPEGQREKVFGAFEQRQGQSHARYGGTGLGLAISRRLVEMMGGRIELVSEEGRGSTFHLRFDRVEVCTPVERPADRDRHLQSLHFTPARVLVVDDVATNRELLRVVLEDAGLQVTEAADGRQALEAARREPPDLVLMDMRMPGMNGFEAVAAMRSDPRLGRIPVVAVTASAVLEERERARTVCDGYVDKPVSRADLMRQLRRFLAVAGEGEEQRPGRATGPAAAPASGDERLAAPAELMDILQGELRQTWSDVQRTRVVNHVEEFAGRAGELGERHGCAALADWGHELRDRTERFDVEAAEEILATFPELVERIVAHNRQVGQ